MSSPNIKQSPYILKRHCQAKRGACGRSPVLGSFQGAGALGGQGKVVHVTGHFRGYFVAHPT